MDYNAFIENKDFHAVIQTVLTADRVLGGIYKFRAVDALDFSPAKALAGEYTISAREMGKWTTNNEGQVYLEHLKVGLTNLQLIDDPNFFNVIVNGAKVVKGES